MHSNLALNYGAEIIIMACTCALIVTGGLGKFHSGSFVCLLRWINGWRPKSCSVGPPPRRRRQSWCSCSPVEWGWSSLGSTFSPFRRPFASALKRDPVLAATCSRPVCLCSPESAKFIKNIFMKIFGTFTFFFFFPKEAIFSCLNTDKCKIYLKI